MTWGSGLNPDTRVVDAYPYKLAKLLDAELIDLSKPGESCQYVVRTTIEFFIDRLDEDLSDYIVLLQMPIGLRFEWWKEEHGEADWSGLIIADSDKKEIIEFFGNHVYECYNTLNNIMQVGSFLKENNIRYYISTMGEEFEDISNTDKITKRRIEYIETNYNILGGSLNNSRLAGEAPSKEINIPGDGHMSEHGHTVAANNIYRLINDR